MTLNLYMMKCIKFHPTVDEFVSTETGPHLNIKTIFPRYGDSHIKDKTVTRPSYL